MLYTRKGDRGTSGLFGSKKRLQKDNLVYDALGTLDELTSFLGVCRAYALRSKADNLSIAGIVLDTQHCVSIIEAELAGASKKMTKKHIEKIERTIDKLEKIVGNPHAFTIPGATVLSASFDYARSVARRAERCVVHVGETHPVSSETLAYLNRLSSLLYVLARFAAYHAGVKELSPTY
jgi:cob(I)alamin adenosyltransferase